MHACMHEAASHSSEQRRQKPAPCASCMRAQQSPFSPPESDTCAHPSLTCRSQMRHKFAHAPVHSNTHVLDHRCTHARIHTCTQTQMQTCPHAHIRKCTHACAHTCTQLSRTCVCLHTPIPNFLNDMSTFVSAIQCFFTLSRVCLHFFLKDLEQCLMCV